VLSGCTDPHTAQARAQVARTVGVVQTLTAELVRHPLLPVLISPLMVVGDAAMAALALCGASCDKARITPLPAGVDALAVVDQQTAACAESADGAVFGARTWLSVEGSAESVAAFERILDPGADDEAVRRARLHYVTEATRQMGD